MCDSNKDVFIKNSIVFRTSLVKSRQTEWEFSTPVWHEDFIQKYLNNQIPIRQKQAQPKIGFCGLAHLPQRNLKAMLKRVILPFLEGIGWRSQRPLTGHQLRGLILSNLSQSPLITPNFIIKDQFWGGSVPKSGQQWNFNFKKQVRLEYVNNMVDSDYVLCVAGAGNYSIRLYETLCCGRIPIFINTDCVLPYDFELNWRQYCVWIEQDEISQVAEKVAEFHHRLSPQDFIDLQYQCRQLWKQWLSPEGFFANFYRHFHRSA